jgi:hypothetical protein
MELFALEAWVTAGDVETKSFPVGINSLEVGSKAERLMKNLCTGSSLLRGPCAPCHKLCITGFVHAQDRCEPDRKQGEKKKARELVLAAK